MIKMKDAIGQNTFWNLPPRNPTQTVFRRFAKVPHGAVRSAFSDSQEDFAKSNPLTVREIDTPFSDILGPLVLGEEEET